MPLAHHSRPPRGASILRGGPRRAPRRSPARRIAVASLVAVLLGALIAGIPAVRPADPAAAIATTAGATGAVSTTARLAEEGEDPVVPELVIAPQQPVLGVGTAEYVFEVLVRNPAEQELPGGTLQLRFALERFENAEQLADFEAGVDSEAGEAKPSTANDVTLAEVEVEATGPESEQAFTVTVARSALPLDAVSLPGVYGVRAEFLSDGGSAAERASSPPTRLSATTTAVWRGLAFGQRVPLALVVPLMLPDDVRSMPSRSDLGDAAPRLDALLTAAERWQATLAVDPRIVAGIRAYGDAAPQAARDLLERLDSSPLPMFMLQFADADPATQAALGFTELLQPVGLSYVTRDGSFEAPAPETDDATGTMDGVGEGEADGSTGEGAEGGEGAATDPLAPDLSQLLAWPQASPGAWPADGQVDTGTLALLQGSGITQLVLDSSNVTGADTARAQVGDFDTLLADGSLGDAARLAISGASETERAGGFAELASRLALEAQPAEDLDAGAVAPAALVLALDRGSVADADAPAQIIEDLTALDWVRPLSAENLTVSRGTLKPGELSKQRTELLTETVARSEEIDKLAPLLDQPGYLIQYQRVRLLNSLATRYAAPGVDFTAVDRLTRNRDEALLAGVQIVPSENTQLVGVSSNVPVLVHNALPFDALITLRASPTSAAVVLSDHRFAGETVGAEGNSTVLVPVRSRVSSGSSGLFVQIADSSDDAVFSTDVLRLTIRSSYETILLITLSALAVALLGFGVWRSILRRRNAGAAKE